MKAHIAEYLDGTWTHATGDAIVDVAYLALARMSDGRYRAGRLHWERLEGDPTWTGPIEDSDGAEAAALAYRYLLAEFYHAVDLRTGVILG